MEGGGNGDMVGFRSIEWELGDNRAGARNVYAV